MAAYVIRNAPKNLGELSMQKIIPAHFRTGVLMEEIIINDLSRR
jgi:hypothetical protein